MRRRRLQAPGVPAWPSLRVSRSPSLHRWHHRLDRRVAVDSDMPVLLVRDPASGVRSGADQSPPSRHGMVRFPDTLLIITNHKVDSRFNFFRA